MPIISGEMVLPAVFMGDMIPETPSTGRVLIVLHQRALFPWPPRQPAEAPAASNSTSADRDSAIRLPETLADYAGAIVFGGPMSANDEEDWLRREIDWIKVPLNENKPFLGICLGAQMLARHLGHRVYAHPDGKVEVGYYPIQPTDHGHRICECPFPEQVYQWHREGFDLPAGATLLASGEDFEAQAFRYGAAAYGFQFHPEVTFDMMCRWSIKGADKMVLPGAQPRHLHIEGWHRHDAPIARWTDAFLERMGRARADVRRLILVQRVQIAHHRLHPRVEHMRVDLGGRNIGVPKQFLHDAQIGPILQKMARESVAQHMRADARHADPCQRRDCLQFAGEDLPA